jgi:hypothetical protein
MLTGTKIGAPDGFDVKFSLPTARRAGAAAGAHTECMAKLRAITAGPSATVTKVAANCPGCQRCLKQLDVSWGNSLLVSVRARAARVKGIKYAASEFSAPLNVTA